MEEFTLLQWAILLLIGLPIAAIILVASIAVVGFVLWWTIKLIFLGSVVFILVLLVAVVMKAFSG